MTQTPPTPGGPDVVDGWKAIADHLGKSARTAQRWSRDFGLPVHKLGTGGREHVYAYRSELDDWRRRASRVHGTDAGSGGVNPSLPNDGGPDGEANGAGPGEGPNADGSDPNGADSSASRPGRPGRSSRVRRLMPAVIAGGIAVVMMAAAFVGWIGLVSGPPATDPGPPVPKQPARYLVVADRLRVFTADGSFLWEHRFDREIVEANYLGHNDPERLPLASEGPPIGAPPSSVTFADVDGDGGREVLFVAYFRASPIVATLYCFESGGGVRWEFTSPDRLSFGGEDYGVPTFIPWVHAHRGMDGATSIWLTSHHHLWFPSVVYRLDRDGQIVARFVSNGRIQLVAFGDGGGVERVLLGGVNNEVKSASLAVFSLARFGGVAPAEMAKYRCDGCPAVYPDHYLVFPPSDVAAAFGGMAFVVHIAVTAAQEAAVSVLHGTARLPGDAGDSRATTDYSLDGNFRVRGAERSQQFRTIHDYLFRAGRLGRPYDEAREQAQLWPVLRWDGSRYARITGPER